MNHDSHELTVLQFLFFTALVSIITVLVFHIILLRLSI